VIVKKRKRRLNEVDEIVLSLYARGLTTGEISAHFAQIYGASVPGSRGRLVCHGTHLPNTGSGEEGSITTIDRSTDKKPPTTSTTRTTTVMPRTSVSQRCWAVVWGWSTLSAGHCCVERLQAHDAANLPAGR